MNDDHDHDDQDDDDTTTVITIDKPLGKPPAPGRHWPMIGPPSGA
jgi:hypothetical protein